MIKVNELRLGNLTSAGVVNEILQDCFYVHDGESSLKNTWFNIQPLPISKEWLLKFGFFENINHNPSWQLDVKLGFSIWGRIGKGFNVFVDSDEIGNPIKYVHQLQNLYFSLTGEELTTN